MGLKLLSIFIKGGAGQLEAKYFHNPEADSIALIMSPHPLHGGTMNNKVVYNLFHTFRENGMSVLRFNYRGVGKSHGKLFDGGECLDASMALDWLQGKNPQAQTIWVAGFSFGAYIAMQIAMRRPEVTHFVSVAPVAQAYDFSFFQPPIPGLIIHGTDDTIAPEPHVHSLYESLKRNGKIQYEIIEGADHFFTKHQDELSSVLQHYIDSSDIAPSNKKVINSKRRRRPMMGT